MKLVVVGQPFSGKSTIFREVIGYRAETASSIGAPIELPQGEVEIDGERATVVDVPGLYSLQLGDQDDPRPVEQLLAAVRDATIIDVVDATVLSRSLEFTLQLLELRRPMVVALNMVDDASRKGIEIDADRLARALGVPVVATNGKTGDGVAQLFATALAQRKSPGAERLLTRGAAWFDGAVDAIGARLVAADPALQPERHLLAIKLLERDPLVRERLRSVLGADGWAQIEDQIAALEAQGGQRSELAVSAVRHNLAFVLFEQVARVGRTPRRDLKRELDRIFMHPVLGYLMLALILAGAFALVFLVGRAIEPAILALFDRTSELAAAALGRDTVSNAVAHGILAGIGGGMVIAVPYLLPFFLILSLLEDSGYIARIAYLLDGLLHRIGLHGTSVIPLVLGYGCTVPGILATRILNSRRDKLITATLTSLIPCSARMTIIFGLVGFFISLPAAIGVYAIDLVVVIATGKVLSAAMPEVNPGLLMELPRYHLPQLKALAHKTWFRLREFVIIAWPLLIAGSVVLELINHWQLTPHINAGFAFFTRGVLGLPPAVGITLLFGLLRKELALVLLFGALGTSDVGSVLSSVQIFTFVVFVTFYVPCLATIAALARELGWRTAAAISVVTFGIAVAIAVGVRLVGALPC
ncbi:MAG: ferrous iron transport protein B [Deltaproteobacteria bacterium]|nr:ferrous iron transport protein B [Deltaproteobacteria bacterium]